MARYKYRKIVLNDDSEPIQDITATLYPASNLSSPIQIYDGYAQTTLRDSINSDINGKVEFWVDSDQTEIAEGNYYTVIYTHDDYLDFEDTNFQIVI